MTSEVNTWRKYLTDYLDDLKLTELEEELYGLREAERRGLVRIDRSGRRTGLVVLGGKIKKMKVLKK